jgi:hypothetical protein|nr:MAG TPA_asm: hypothetical protein [Caudoviricetes sp.]
MVIRDLTRGDSAYFELSIKDENNELTTVDKIFMTVKEDWDSDTIKFQKKIDKGIYFEDGIYKIFIDPEDTNELEFGRYVYDVEIIKGDIKTTIEAGILNINHEVTCASDEV